MSKWRTMAAAGLAMLAVAAGGCVEAGGPERAEVATDTGGAETGGAETRGAAAGAAGVAIRLAGPGGAALLVPVRINGSGPYDFVLDTGATLTCVDTALADSLGLPEARGRVGVGAGIGGAPASMRLVEIDSLSVGDARAHELTGCAVGLEQLRAIGLEAHGLLGLDFLTSFRVTLDFGRDRLLLEETGA